MGLVPRPHCCAVSAVRAQEGPSIAKRGAGAARPQGLPRSRSRIWLLPARGPQPTHPRSPRRPRTKPGPGPPPSGLCRARPGTATRRPAAGWRRRGAQGGAGRGRGAGRGAEAWLEGGTGAERGAGGAGAGAVPPWGRGRLREPAGSMYVPPLAPARSLSAHSTLLCSASDNILLSLFLSIYRLIGQAGWNRCNLSIYLSTYYFSTLLFLSFLSFYNPVDNTNVTIYNHLISQAGWNRCNLSIFSALPCPALLHSTPLHSTPLHSTPLHCTALHSTPLHSTPLCLSALFLTIYFLVPVSSGVVGDSICFQDLPGDIQAHPASALCGWKDVILSLCLACPLLGLSPEASPTPGLLALAKWRTCSRTTSYQRNGIVASGKSALAYALGALGLQYCLSHMCQHLMLHAAHF